MKLLVFAFMVVLSGCATAPSPSPVHPDYARIDRDVRVACEVAKPLALDAGPYAPFIIGACMAGEAGIHKLASDPESVAWLNGIIDKVHRHEF